MLKSTYQPAVAPSRSLPEGWTEHKAPTGHLYFYNSVTKESTYTRPQAAEQRDPRLEVGSGPFHAFRNGFNNAAPPFSAHSLTPSRQHQPNFRDEYHRRGFEQNRGQQPPDRPKSKIAIPDCEPWDLVTTRLGRRFVHNRESGESFWRFPPDVMKSVTDHDRFEREKKARKEAQPDLPEDGDMATAESAGLAADTLAPSAAPRPMSAAMVEPVRPLLDSDGEELEEVEVTDDEDEENASKKQKTETDGLEAPVEFDEEDIAYQLAAMGEDYGLDPGEYDDGGDGDLEEGAEGLPLTEEDSSALFKDMLNDCHVSPYSLWDKLIEDGHIVNDDRYTVLPNMKTRKEVYAEWSREKIQSLKDQRAMEEKKDPRVPYLAFLESKATPKLYWPEFRRKYQKEPDMKSTKLSDKDREKAYREYIQRLKLPESTLKADLVSLLKSMPIHALNRSSNLNALPAAMLTDLRYISLRATVRSPLIEAHVSALPSAPTDDDVSPEEEAARAKEQKERQRRERALFQRQGKVDDEKRRQKSDLYRSKGRLREEEEEVQRAMRVGKDGLLGYMD